MLFVSKYGACEVRLSEIRRLSPYMEGEPAYEPMSCVRVEILLASNLSVDNASLI